MSNFYYDTKSQGIVELMEINDKDRFMIIRPINSEVAARLEFSDGFLPSNYLDKYFTKQIPTIKEKNDIHPNR